MLTTSTIQVDHGLSPIFGILGGFDGSGYIRSTSQLNTATPFYCSILRFDRIDIILRHQGMWYLVRPQDPCIPNRLNI